MATIAIIVNQMKVGDLVLVPNSDDSLLLLTSEFFPQSPPEYTSVGSLKPKDTPL